MIGHLEGVLREKIPTRVLIVAGGVGYAVQIPLSTFTELPDTGKTVGLHVHTHVREDALQLFGFHTRQELAVFELLIGASRIGPRLAQTILSGIETDRLVAAIAGGKVAVLRSIPGVGAKMAERIVVELRDKVDAALISEVGESAAPSAEIGGYEQALSALVHLGYSKKQAERVVEEASGDVGPDGAVADLIRAALRRLSA